MKFCRGLFATTNLIYLSRQIPLLRERLIVLLSGGEALVCRVGGAAGGRGMRMPGVAMPWLVGYYGCATCSRSASRPCSAVQTSVIVIHGSVGREERLAAQEAFRHDPQVQVLLATDAAGEGINLQRAHLMVNYDLPWNPNRLEQRFGRIHRIGQTEVCTCGTWSPTRPARATSTGGCSRSWNRPGRRSAARSSTCSASWSSKGGRCASCCSTPSATASSRRSARGSTLPSTRRSTGRRCRTCSRSGSSVHDAMDANRVQRVREEMERAEGAPPAARRRRLGGSAEYTHEGDLVRETL